MRFETACFSATFDANGTMMISSGRKKEARLIRKANRAAAVGRLMLGAIRNWQEFLEADTLDLEDLPRRQLKSGRADVRNRLSHEMKTFCTKNFEGLDVPRLSMMYEEIKAHRGLELPLSEFESRFARVRREVLRGAPSHSTVCVSLWGLQFKFPEHELSQDVLAAIAICVEAHEELRNYEGMGHEEAKQKRDRIRNLFREHGFAVRALLIGCFNLLEAYLNGLAWDFIQVHGTAGLSNRKRSLLEDSTSVSIRDKLRKYPEAVTGRELWQPEDSELDEFLDRMKPFRDSLVHPSPFSAPDRFGGHDKLRLFYRIDHGTALTTIQLLVRLLRKIHLHVFQERQSLPQWLEEINLKIQDLGVK